MKKRENILLLFMGLIVLIVLVVNSNKPAEASITRTVIVSAQGQSTRIANAFAFSFDVAGTAMDIDAVIQLMHDTTNSLNVVADEHTTTFINNFYIHSAGNFDGLSDLMNPRFSYRVTLYDLTTLEDVLGQLSQFEGFSVQNSSFFYTDVDSMLTEAQDNALELAYASAARIAQTNNRILGEITSIDFSGYGNGYAPVRDNDYSKLLETADLDNFWFNPPPILVVSNVTVTYELR